MVQPQYLPGADLDYSTTGHGDKNFYQSTRFIGGNNKAIDYDAPEAVRDRNASRLKKLESTYD